MSPQDRMSIKDISDYVGIGINNLQRKSVRERLGIPIVKIGRNLISFRPLMDKWIEKKLNG